MGATGRTASARGLPLTRLPSQARVNMRPLANWLVRMGTAAVMFALLLHAQSPRDGAGVLIVENTRPAWGRTRLAQARYRYPSRAEHVVSVRCARTVARRRDYADRLSAIRDRNGLRDGRDADRRRESGGDPHAAGKGAREPTSSCSTRP